MTLWTTFIATCDFNPQSFENTEFMKDFKLMEAQTKYSN